MCVSVCILHISGHIAEGIGNAERGSAHLGFVASDTLHSVTPEAPYPTLLPAVKTSETHHVLIPKPNPT